MRRDVRVHGKRSVDAVDPPTRIRQLLAETRLAQLLELRIVRDVRELIDEENGMLGARR
jgi:hypothetical protein